MEFITGGAYQGKLTFAKKKYGFGPEQIFPCTQDRIDFSYPCVTHIEEFAYGCVLRGTDPIAYFEAHRAEWAASVLICRDIFCGLVPMDATQRAWREATGRLCQYLTREAGGVSRIFCGLEQRLK